MVAGGDASCATSTSTTWCWHHGRARAQPGDRLPSTTELAEIARSARYRCAERSTNSSGPAGSSSRQGLGTFVAEPRIASDPTRPGELLHTLIDEGGALPAVTTSLITVGVGLPSRTIATALGVEIGQPVWEIWRRRSIGGTDRILERAVLPLSRVPAIDQERLDRGESRTGSSRNGTE